MWILEGLLALPLASQSAEEEDIIRQAEQRIRAYRTAELTVFVVDAQEKPVEGVEVEIRQTRHAFLFGCNIFGWLQPTPHECDLYREQFAALLNYATLPFYWSGYEPRPGQPQHASRETIARWCRERGITPKGHPLVWNHKAGTPEWLPEDPAEVVRLSNARVEEIVRRFQGLIEVWDVVNEAADPFRAGPDFQGALTEAWRHFGKMSCAKEAFLIARRANSQATLLINDYRVDGLYEEVLRQLTDDAGRPLYDVIGIQSHMHGGVWPTQKIWDVCERFARFGAPLHFTEVTILSGPRTPEGWNTTPEGEQKQAEEVERFYTVLFSHPAVEAITWWDFSDRFAWQNAPAGLLRKDLSPKPAYERLKSLIKGKWWTHVRGQTQAGRFSARAFYGEYEIIVRHEGQEIRQSFSLKKDGEKTLRIVL